MEFEVRVVGGVESCFVSLPLSLIQTLQSTSSAPLPHLLALELRSRSNSIWHVAWSGSASASFAIEVAQQFANCIGLLDHTTVQVLAISNLPKATQVTVEPDTEDDWEVMELNSEHAEAAILTQIGIVHAAMRFPLWLHGHTVVTFFVVSVFPKKSVVQLVPGTEVYVSPKGRPRIVDRDEDCKINPPKEGHACLKTLLRVQDSNINFIKKNVIEGVELGVAPTSLAFIHPETAKKYSLDILQLLVIMPKLTSKKSLGNAGKNPKKGNSSNPNEVDNGISTDNKDLRQAIVRLVMLDSVCSGHIMLTPSLRLYLRAGLCSWVYVKSCNIHVKKDASSLSLSPCRFKMFDDDDFEADNSRTINKSNKKSSTYLNFGSFDWSINEEIIASLPYESYKIEDAVAAKSGNNRRGLQSLLQEWFLAQLDAIATYTGLRVNSLIIGNETLLHIEVKAHNLEASKGVQASELLFVMTSCDESLPDGNVIGYELFFNKDHQKKDHLGTLRMFENIVLGKPIIFYSSKEAAPHHHLSTVSTFSLTETIVSDIINRLTVLLSHVSQIWLGGHNLSLPGHVLIYGPPGSGKTTLTKSIAKYIEENENLLAYVVFVSCSGLSLEKAPSIRQALSRYISEALDHAPSLVILDDLDRLVSTTTESDGSQTSASVLMLTQFLADIIDEYAEKRVHSCGIGPIAFLASVQTLENVPQSLSSSGRFDFHVQLSSLGTSRRGAILKHEIRKRFLHCSDDLLLDIASKCDGYDAYDLVILVDRAVHAAIGRFVTDSFIPGGNKLPTLVREDFSEAMHEFLPVAMREINKSASEVGHCGWDNVGGLTHIRVAIREMIELPSKFPNIFAQAPLRLRSNVLLYGPPGCGKTHIVGAAAAACSLRFISIKGPELLNKYIGASEQAVRDIFSKAAAAAPCILFFDEFDSIAPKRGHDNTGVTDRVVNQFLTELDGLEALTGVFVFAASSRPDLLDGALLRPGRFDRLLFCDFPSQQERLEILAILSRKLPLDDDMDLDCIAHMTQGFSGADLQALLSDAQLTAVHHFLDNNNNEGGMKAIITNAILISIASKANPSVSESEKRKLYGIYNQFLDSKLPVAKQSTDSKGKRATLA